jgi:hypothetical protein
MIPRNPGLDGREAAVARTLLYLVRHGEQDQTPGAATGGGLSARGRWQAERLGRRLAGVPFSTIHHSPLPRAARTAEVISGFLPDVPRHECDFATDRTPVPSAGRRGDYPDRFLPWLDAVPQEERDEDATGLRAAVQGRRSRSLSATPTVTPSNSTDALANTVAPLVSSTSPHSSAKMYRQR